VRSVLLLDDDDDLRAVLSELFTTYDARCLSVGSVDELMALGPRGLACDLAVLDVNLGAGRPSGIDAYEWLKAQRFGGQIVFLTGHARSYPTVAKAQALGIKVLEKPVHTAELARLLTGVDS
jgi:DNA-binding NtrC family response regulator